MGFVRRLKAGTEINLRQRTRDKQLFYLGTNNGLAGGIGDTTSAQFMKIGIPKEIKAQLIFKVKEPQPSEVTMLRPDHILFTYLHLAANQTLTESPAAIGCASIAYETIEVNHRLPLLEPMREIAGRMSAIVGSCHLAKHRGGRGCLLGGVPGVAPGRVVVLGGGTAGVNPARVATGIGADVTILEVDFERIRFLDITRSGTSTVFSNEANLSELHLA